MPKKRLNLKICVNKETMQLIELCRPIYVFVGEDVYQGQHITNNDVVLFALKYLKQSYVKL